MDPILTSDGKPYAPERLKQLVKERYYIAKNCNTSYTDTGKMSFLERKYLLEFIQEEMEYRKNILDSQNKN